VVASDGNFTDSLRVYHVELDENIDQLTDELPAELVDTAMPAHSGFADGAVVGAGSRTMQVLSWTAAEGTGYETAFQIELSCGRERRTALPANGCGLNR